MADPIPFALSPALVTNQPIDYSTRTGQALYVAGIAALDEDNRFDASATNLRVFLTQITDRSNKMGWSTILNVPDDVEDPLGAAKFLPHRYGELTLEHVRHYAEQVIVGVQSRAAQDSAMLYHCIVNSLTTDAWARISLHSEDYLVNNVPDGLCLLRVVIRESHVDTNATTAQLRTALTQLDAAMVTYAHDIKKFNEYVQGLVQSLAARGQRSDDLLINLFKGYKACADHKFLAYIELKESEYEEGKDITPNELMHLALNKYLARVEKKMWKAPSVEQQKILALEAELKRLKGAKKPNANSNSSDKKPAGKKDEKTRPDRKREKPAWMLKPPTENEKAKGSTKKVDGKQYWWCPKHNAWTRHTPAECRLPEGGTKRKKESAKENPKEEKDGKKTLKLSEAVVAGLTEE